MRMRSPPAGSLKKGERDASPYQCFGKQQEEGANGASQVLRFLPTLPLATRSFSARRRPGVTSRERLTDEDARATVSYDAWGRGENGGGVRELELLWQAINLGTSKRLNRGG